MKNKVLRRFRSAHCGEDQVIEIRLLSDAAGNKWRVEEWNDFDELLSEVTNLTMKQAERHYEKRMKALWQADRAFMPVQGDSYARA